MTIRTFSFKLFGRTIVLSITKPSSDEDKIKVLLEGKEYYFPEKKYVAVNTKGKYKLTFPKDINKDDFYSWVEDKDVLREMRKSWINAASKICNDEVLAHQYSQMNNEKWRDYLKYRFLAFSLEEE